MSAAAVTAIAGAISAVVALFTTVIAMLIQVKRGVSEVHSLVNSRLTATLERVEQLEAVMKSAGTKIPKAQELFQKVASEREDGLQQLAYDEMNPSKGKRDRR